MSGPIDQFLSKIEVFIVRKGMTPTAFGLAAAGDPRFVFDLRDGRECRTATRERVFSFMKAARATASSRAA